MKTAYWGPIPPLLDKSILRMDRLNLCVAVWFMFMCMLFCLYMFLRLFVVCMWAYETREVARKCDGASQNLLVCMKRESKSEPACVYEMKRN